MALYHDEVAILISIIKHGNALIDGEKIKEVAFNGIEVACFNHAAFHKVECEIRAGLCWVEIISYLVARVYSDLIDDLIGKVQQRVACAEIENGDHPLGAP